MSTFIERLDEITAECWAKIHRGPFWQHLLEHGLDRELYIDLMVQVYGFTKYNAQNQALAALRVTSDRVQLLRFCLEHAFEEAGHDLMVLKDLESIGVDRQQVKSTRLLPATQAFTAYVFRVASEQDATARLGYSFWAEGSYTYLDALLVAMRRDLGLANSQMTFFVAHSEIDREHLADVIRIIDSWCTSEEQQADLINVLRTTLALTGSIFNEVYEQNAPRLRRVHAVAQAS